MQGKEEEPPEEPDKTSTNNNSGSPANTIKDAALTLLAHLLKFVHDFPSTLGKQTHSNNIVLFY